MRRTLLFIPDISRNFLCYVYNFIELCFSIICLRIIWFFVREFVFYLTILNFLHIYYSDVFSLLKWAKNVILALNILLNYHTWKQHNSKVTVIKNVNNKLVCWYLPIIVIGFLFFVPFLSIFLGRCSKSKLANLHV